MHIDEMIRIAETVARINRAVTWPYIKRKTGLTVINPSASADQIVTEADVGVSKALLDGFENFKGLRAIYNGSFSEESDSPDRLSALALFEVDPIDGTGDFVDSYQSGSVIGPTTLVTKLVRNYTSDDFTPAAGLIFDIVTETAIVGDGYNTLLFVVRPDGTLQEVAWKRPELDENPKVITINRRPSYPQLVYDGPFMRFLQRNGVPVSPITTGGAGRQIMQFLRNYIEPTEGAGNAFKALEPLNVIFNVQPDWKTWDIDPLLAIASQWLEPATYYGSLISLAGCGPNAAREEMTLPKLADPYDLSTWDGTAWTMQLREGFVVATTNKIRALITELANRFEDENPSFPLLSTDYEYKKAIIAFAGK